MSSVATSSVGQNEDGIAIETALEERSQGQEVGQPQQQQQQQQQNPQLLQGQGVQVWDAIVPPPPSSAEQDLPDASPWPKTFRVKRPKQHNFCLARPRHDNDSDNDGGGQQQQQQGLTKNLLAAIIDTQRTAPTLEFLAGIQTAAAALHARAPSAISLLRRDEARGVREDFAGLLDEVRRFRRQHEGYVALGEVALRHRDEREAHLRWRFDCFWLRWVGVRRWVRDVRAACFPMRRGFARMPGT
ncbi:hypothetical protein F4820DRAFT_466295 [Hypoxylon rubiginosum]|uniref:Uncharacterized protein n=1 Tax=Hypoxylon rubiginosum TaxID=110542 RepID=A0ACB9Z9W1_9PEZI|nr:hypothetical protein F4820DRAFT_466295 [Hypoxylon rubiginosum]